MGSQEHQRAVLDMWLSRAQAGEAEAYYQLGLIYVLGAGVDADYVAAHKWFNLAALAGDDRAVGERADLASQMSSHEVVMAQRQARSWIEQRA